MRLRVDNYYRDGEGSEYYVYHKDSHPDEKTPFHARCVVAAGDSYAVVGDKERFSPEGVCGDGKYPEYTLVDLVGTKFNQGRGLPEVIVTVPRGINVSVRYADE